MNCISGDFIVELTPCAPNSEFGLSAPTGGATLVGTVERWQDYTTHFGGVSGNSIDDHGMFFSGGFNSPSSDNMINQNRASVGLPPLPDGNKIPEGQGYEQLWSFSINRLTGKAILKEKSKADTVYTCKKAKAIL